MLLPEQLPANLRLVDPSRRGRGFFINGVLAATLKGYDRLRPRSARRRRGPAPATGPQHDRRALPPDSRRAVSTSDWWMWIRRHGRVAPVADSNAANRWVRVARLRAPSDARPRRPRTIRHHFTSTTSILNLPSSRTIAANCGSIALGEGRRAGQDVRRGSRAPGSVASKSTQKPRGPEEHSVAGDSVYSG